MKVLFTLDSLGNAGAEKSTLDNAAHFSKETSVTVATFYPEFELKSAYEKAGIALRYLDLKGKRSFLTGIWRLVKLIRREKPDVVVSSIMRADLMSRIACLLTRTKLVGTLVSDSYCDIRLDEIRKAGNYYGFLFFWKLDKLTARIPRYYISNSLSIAKSNAVNLAIPLNRITVIYRGRSLQRFRPWTPPPAGDAFHFVFIGRVLEQKGLKELLQAFGRLYKERPHVRLHCYGDGRYRKTMEKMILDAGLSGAAFMHGKVPNGWEKLYEAHCFVQPSWFEGFSGSLVEAMLSGVPVIASDIPMNLEAVTDNETALVFPVKDEHSLYGKMKYAVENIDSMIAMGRRAREVASARFSIEHIAESYEGFLRRVVEDRVKPEELAG